MESFIPASSSATGFCFDLACQTSFPTLHMVIPLLNFMMDMLDDMEFTDDPVMEQTHEAILAKLQENYTKTDLSCLFIISLGECPNHLCPPMVNGMLTSITVGPSHPPCIQATLHEAGEMG